MESLPQVIVDHIASYVEARDLTGIYAHDFRSRPSCLPNLATLSRKWQYAIERRTFRSMHPLTSDELEEFERILGKYDRQSYLRRLYYTIYLDSAMSYRVPNNDMNGGVYVKKNESAEEQGRNNQSFSDAIHKLFAIFKSWEDQSQGVVNLSLSLGNVLARDQIRTPNGPRPGYDELTGIKFQPRFEKSLLRIVDLDKIPLVRGIVQFIAQQRVPRPIHFLVITDILSKLPDAHTVNTELRDEDVTHSNSRRRQRHALGFALQNGSFPALRTLKLHLKNDVDTKQASRPTNLLTDSVPVIDPISEGLRHFSHQLTKLDFEGAIEATFFWTDSMFYSPDSHWPNLQELIVRFLRETPSGGWYFKDRNRSHDDEEVAQALRALINR
ncbi:hypothetical protein BT63DRAFT_423352 [Microthyrium microscopicum]|uniref:F-box domain-containing protein n=1 Tax=Microthyrium microscopicum TaxID=703497 RepID=A0A6A6UH08_9PEZI|nr:hypothetical protein BT63DRAFT_423352 [Microthyrium microscopicum]